MADAQNIDWQDVSHRVVTPAPDGGLRIGALAVERDSTLDFGGSVGAVSVPALAESAERFRQLTDGQCVPQLGALVFSILRRPRALDHYFPLSRTLDAAGLSDFYRLAGDILSARRFDIRLIGGNLVDVSPSMPDVAFFAACHLAEIFFGRRDLLQRLLETRARIRLYATPQVFQRDGGIAGGCFNPSTGTVQLVLSRLYEGFNERTPGVAPFLHEFGHLLDHFDAAKGRMSPRGLGTLPGMRLNDGPLFDAEARRLFIAGKRLERLRYLKLHRTGYATGDPLPIGHPYVFQNDTEFIAGYFEMFFRNPHYFAAQNPDLYQGFALALRQDPRAAWQADFPFYVEANRGYYLKGERPPRPGITL